MGDERRCERCDSPVERRLLEQWYFKITDYAEELKRFDGIEWPERIRQAQLNWIGDRSEGAEVVFRTEQGDEIVIFTTRPDTLWGATFMVLAPEHPLVDKLTPASHREQRQGVPVPGRPADGDRARRRPSARRPVSPSARTRSTRSTANASRSGSRTT